MATAKNKKKILVVDDEEMLVDMITMRLEANGYEVASAGDGLEGLAKVSQFAPDLIILDINMAGMDGYTMLKELRGDKQFGKTKVIMLTASGKGRELFEKEGISDYITKPFDADDLLARISKVLQSKKRKE